jgi:hypothetical protein
LFVSFPINLPIAVRNFNKGMTDSPKPKVMVDRRVIGVSSGVDGN